MRTRRQSGMSLVSLMIGLLISMFGILGVMSMHKSLIQVSVESKSDAIHDGMISSAVMRLQKVLLNAGYGMETASAADVRTATVNSAPALLWRYNEGGTYQCLGVSEKSYTDSISNTAGRELILMNASSGCSDSVDLSTLTWNETDKLAQFKNQANTLFSFSVAAANCAPFGLGVAESHLQVTVSAQSSAEVAGAGVSAVQYEFCLMNTHL